MKPKALFLVILLAFVAFPFRGASAASVYVIDESPLGITPTAVKLVNSSNGVFGGAGAVGCALSCNSYIDNSEQYPGATRNESYGIVTQVSWGLWINGSQGTTTGSTFIWRPLGTGEANAQFGIRVSGSSTTRCEVSTAIGGTTAGTSFGALTNGYAHYFCTMNFATHSLISYKNGTLQGSVTAQTGRTRFDSTNETINIGRKYQGTDDGPGTPPYSGIGNNQFDEVRVYNRELSSTEVSAIASNSNPTSSGLVLYYSFGQTVPGGRATVYLCKDSIPYPSGGCLDQAGPLPNVTYTATGVWTGSGTTGTDGVASVNRFLYTEGLTWINLTSTGNDLYAGPQIAFATVDEPLDVPVFMWQRASYCQPPDQSVTVPSQAVFNYTITQRERIIFFTYFKQDPTSLSLTPIRPTAQLAGTFGNLSYPGVPTQNGTNGQFQNDTGSYALVLADETGRVVNVCTFEIQTTGTNFQPIVIDDMVNTTFQQSMTQGITRAKISQQDQQKIAKNAVRDFGEFAWRRPLQELYAFTGMDVTSPSTSPFLYLVCAIPWMGWLLIASASLTTWGMMKNRKREYV